VNGSVLDQWLIHSRIHLFPRCKSCAKTFFFIGLKKFLHKIGRAETDECDCGMGCQSSIHVLMQCPLHIALRKEMFEGIGRKCTDYNALASDPKVARYVVKFMLQTGLLTQFKAVEQAGDEGREGLGAVKE
jgi:hypothetical protein